jgi:PAS domain S-box-containing protein
MHYLGRRETWTAVTAVAAAVCCAAIAHVAGAPVALIAGVAVFVTAFGVHALRDPRRAAGVEAAVEHLADVFVTLDDGWRLTFVNQRAADFARAPARSLIGRSLWNVAPRLHGSDVGARLREAMTSRRTDAFEFRHDESRRWFELHLHPIPAGLAVYAREVTERHRWEDALRESESRFRMLADSAPVLIWVIDETGKPEFWNRTHREFTGHLRGLPTVEGWRALVHPDDASELARVHETSREGGLPFEARFRIRRHDGQWRWLKAVGLPRRDERGRFVGWVGSSLDITDLKDAEESAREADRRKDDFIAVLAHELRSPLGPVRNAADVLCSEGPSDSRLARARDIVVRQVAHMSRLIDDLLDVSRIARDKIELRRTWLDLRVLVREVVDDVRLLLDRKAQVLTVSLPETPLVVDVDPARLRQVIANLLGNAAKFTPGHGRIDLALRADAGEVSLSVRDSGSGIRPDVLTRIFEPFVQGESDRRHGGLGIGLTLVRRLAELHGGRVEAYSAGIGRGSEFVVTLPLVPPALPIVRPPHAAMAATGARRVLVVEDDADSAEGLLMLLESQGHVVRTARDGREAVEAAVAFHPEVALVDIGLPDIDGYEVARRLRDDPSCAKATLVALSGYGRDEDKRRALEAGFDHHLLKPADLDELHAILVSVAPPTLH